MDKEGLLIEAQGPFDWRKSAEVLAAGRR